MDIIDRAYDRACCEIEDILQKPKFEGKDVEYFGQFIDIIKDIGEIDMSSDMGYSQMNGSSYSRGRSGRMMPMYGRTSRGRGMDDGYSRHSNRDVMLDHLQDVMDMAVDERDRKAVEKLMDQMSRQN